MKPRLSLQQFFSAPWSKVLFVLAVGLSGGMGCSSEGERPPGQEGEGGGSSGVGFGPCEEDAVRSCGVTVELASGVMSCYRGKQYCEEGKWSACREGQVTKEAVPPRSRRGGFFEAQGEPALSEPAPCDDNPCDPRCMFFDEDPEDITPPNTGTDPGIPDWSRPPGVAPCSHQLCEVGAPLAATCHPCVERVCALDAACCSSAWTSACVDLVYSECVVPPPNELNLCDFSAFGENNVRLGNGASGFPILGSNGNVTTETSGQLGGVYAKGNVNLRNGVNVVGPVVARGSVWVESPAAVTGDISAGGQVDLRNNTVITGNVTTVGNVVLQSGARVTNNVWAGGYVELNNNGHVLGNSTSVGNLTGQAGGRVYGIGRVQSPSTISSLLQVGTPITVPLVEVPPMPVVELPTIVDYRRNLTASCSAANSRPDDTINNGENRILPPGVYGGRIVRGGGTLTLQAGGTYVFKSLLLEANASLRFAGSPKWDVNVCSTFATHAGVTMYLEGTTAKAQPADFIVYSAATSGTGISIGDNNVFDGMFLAPDSEIRVFNGYTGTSAFWGKTVWSDYNLNVTPIPKEACELTNFYGNATCDGTTPLYANKAAYAVGAQVHYKGRLYSCLNGGLCSIGDGYGGGAGYWPGEGAQWTIAWSLVGNCPPPPLSGGVCPVELTIPEVPPPKQVCHSGQDCQVNSHCAEVMTSATCAHSKCVTGSRLSAGCDDCVGRICEKYPTCCNTAWTSACVAQVEKECDAACGGIDKAGCAHDMCAVGTPLNAACSSLVADVCAAMPSCCTTGWTSACITKLGEIVTGGTAPPPPPPGSSRCDYAVMTSSALSMYAAHVSGGDVRGGSGTNSINLDWGTRPQLSGNVYSPGAMTLANADVTGSARSTGTMTCSGCTVGVGTATGGATIPSVSIPTKTFTCPTGGTAQTISSNQTLAPGAYGAITVSDWSGAVLTLQAGTYNVTSLNVGSNTRLQLPATGTVVINSCGTVRFGSSSQVLGASTQADALRLQIYSASTANSNSSCSGNAICVESSIYATLTAPSGGGWLSQSSVLNGFLQTDRAYLFQQSRVNASGVLGSACQAAGLDGNAGWVCDVTTPLESTVLESGTCVDNETSFQVPTSWCAGADLAVDINCFDNTVPVCNHGNTAVPANAAELIFYPRSGQQFATESPDPHWEVGRCTVTSVIPAGGCVDQVCLPSLLSRDLTVEVQMRAGSSVRECSVLDNWSYYIEGRSCTGAQPLVVAYEYEATCPADSSPRWAVLAWNTETPGSSFIQFEGRVARSSAELTSGLFVPLALAQASPVNTQVCPPLSAQADCPADLTAKLWPGRVPSNQPTFLELRATLQPVGLDLPTLRDWEVRYSCVYDQ